MGHTCHRCREGWYLGAPRTGLKLCRGVSSVSCFGECPEPGNGHESGWEMARRLVTSGSNIPPECHLDAPSSKWDFLEFIGGLSPIFAFFAASITMTNLPSRQCGQFQADKRLERGAVVRQACSQSSRGVGMFTSRFPCIGFLSK